MITSNLALYKLLVSFGADEKQAEIAAATDTSDLATKQDLALAFAQFEARLAWKIGALIVGAMVSMTGIFAVIVGWLVRHP